MRLVAYNQFYLATNSTHFVTYKDLKIGDNTTQEEFNLLVNEIKSITDDLCINLPIIDRNQTQITEMFCGDGNCDTGENSENCPEDCPILPPST